MTRIRKILSAKRGALFGLALSAAIAGAFFAAQIIGEGEGSGTTGSAPTTEVPLTVTMPDGLAPGVAKHIPITINNNTGGTFYMTKLTVSLETPSYPVCAEKWLEIEPTAEYTPALVNGTAHVEIPQGTVSLGAKNIVPVAQFDASKETADETPCAEIPVVAKAQVEGHA